MLKLGRILLGVLYLARKPTDYRRIEGFREILRRYGYFDAGVARVKLSERDRKILQEKPLIDWPNVDLDRLRRLPTETLGYQLMMFLERNGLDVLTYERDSTLNEVEFFIRRIVQTHDIWHVVLGYRTDVLSELELNSFMLAQIDWPPAGFYISAYLFRTMLTSPSEAKKVIHVVSRGWNRGLNLTSLFAVRWEDHLERPLLTRPEIG
jgi:ubiquinone biosynthesis protein COQ4